MGYGINIFSSGGSGNIRIGKRTSYIHTDNDSASFSTGSDERWKKNIADNSVGLDLANMFWHRFVLFAIVRILFGFIYNFPVPLPLQSHQEPPIQYSLSASAAAHAGL